MAHQLDQLGQCFEFFTREAEYYIIISLTTQSTKEQTLEFLTHLLSGNYIDLSNFTSQTLYCMKVTDDMLIMLVGIMCKLHIHWCACALSTCVHVPVAEWPLSDLDGAELLQAAPSAGSHVGVGHIEALALVAAGATGQAMRRGGKGGGARGGLLHHRYLHATRLVRILIHKLVILQDS